MNRMPANRSRPDFASIFLATLIRGTSRPTINAEAMKVPASIQSTLAVPIRAIRTPASGAPISRAVREADCSMAAMRSKRIEASTARSGIRAARDVLPGTLSKLPRKTKISNCQYCRPIVEWKRGTMAMLRPLIRSDTTLDGLNPSLSTTDPPNRAAMATAMAVKNSAIPVWEALPVVSRTNQGTAITVSWLPSRDIIFAASSPATGRNRREDIVLVPVIRATCLL